MNTFETLRDLMLVPAESGHEQRMAAMMQKKFKELGIESEIDVFGNVIAEVKGTNPKAPSIMVFAHMDSLGLLVRKIDDNGFIRVERLGGIPDKVLPASQVQIETRDGKMIDGYIMVKAKHVTPANEANKVEAVKDLYIDIGVTSKKEAEDLGIEIGSMIVYTPTCTKLQGTRVMGTSLDNRIGCTTVLGVAENVIKNRPESTVYLVGAVQEEFSLSGAQMAAKIVHPDMAICIDVAMDSSAPKMDEIGDCQCGKGPVIYTYNFHGRGTLNGTIAHPKMVEWIEKAGEDAGVPLQRAATVGVLTDLTYVQYVDEGVAALDLGIAGRNLHSPVESIDIKDIDYIVKLISKFIDNINETYDLRRW